MSLIEGGSFAFVSSCMHAHTSSCFFFFVVSESALDVKGQIHFCVKCQFHFNFKFGWKQRRRCNDQIGAVHVNSRMSLFGTLVLEETKVACM